MLEESIDPRPSLAAALAEVLTDEARGMVGLTTEQLAMFWDDAAGDWVNLRNYQHWLERARRV